MGIRLKRTYARGVVAVASVLALVGAGVSTGAAASAAPLPAGDYVVALSDGVDAVAIAKRYGVDIDDRFTEALNGFSVQLTSSEATALAKDTRVKAVSPDIVFTGAAQFDNPTPKSVEADEAPVYAGDGVTPAWNGPAVAVIDSGVNAHPDYNLVRSVNCLGSGDGNDGNGHGTGVSGYMAAYDNSTGTVGVAPGAPIYSVRAMDAKNVGSLSSLVCALDWVATNAATYNIKVANMSLGAKSADDGNCGFSNGDALHQAVCAVTNRGVLITAAAGNTAEDLGLYVPASYDEVFAVTNMADYDGRPGGLGTSPCGTTTRDDMPATTSNFAVSTADKSRTIAAPGTCPYTTLKGNRYGYIQSGTSMATAAVSGVVLNCFASGSCAAKSPEGVIDQVLAQAQSADARGHSFTGDPNSSPVANKYYGYLASTVPTGSVPTPTPTPTVTPTPTPTVTPTPTPTPTVTPTPTPSPTRDSQAPTVSIVSPASGSTVTGSGVIVAEASDNVGVTAVTFWSGTTKLGSGTKQSDGTWRATFSSRAYPNGTYAVVARATDAAGNVANSAPVSLTIRN